MPCGSRDGQLVQVKAAAKSLLEVRVRTPCASPASPGISAAAMAEGRVTGDAIYVENSPAVAELVRGQGCTATPVERPLQARAQHPCLRSRPWASPPS